VLEKIDVAQYTYVRLDAARGPTWAAVTKAPVSVGSQVTVVDATRMDNFKSTSLGRTFDVIFFGNLADSANAPQSAAALPPNHPNIGSGELPAGHPVAATELAGTENIAPLERATGKNAFVIAELFAQKAKLVQQTVRVRGQVVKVTAGVQGKNYLRVRDGSSKEPNQTDLVVTSQTEPRLGDVAIFEGVLRTDVDVGIGFTYPVLLENATLSDVVKSRE
jgi:hypothetical protein